MSGSTRARKYVKPGDLAITRDMGTGSGKIALIVNVNVFKSHEDENAKDYVTYDAVINSLLVDNIHESFLKALEEENESF